MHSKRQAKRAAGKTGVLILLIVFAIVEIFPFLWMLSVSFRTRVGIYDPGNLFGNLTLGNYQEIFDSGILKLFLNSFIVAIFSTLLSLVLGTLAAYGFARFNWKKRESRAFWVLSQRFLPAMAVIIPYYLMGAVAGLLDTRIWLIICYIGFNLPFATWMMRGFIEDVPRELEESAMVDGCSRLAALRKVIFPLVLPGMVATAIFCVINCWNEFVFANFLTTISAKTVPVSVMTYLTVAGVKWGEMAATGILAVLPVMIFAIAVQKYMIRGLTFGSVKG